jgi:hypothetical protein
MLTLQELKDMKPGIVFAHGTTVNAPTGIYMTNEDKGRELLWAAKRGGIHDWAIYIHWADKGLKYVVEHGDKVTSPGNIKKLVPCDDEAFSMYRY